MRHSLYSRAAAAPGSAGGDYTRIHTLATLQVYHSKAREEKENNTTLRATLCSHPPLQLNWAAFQTQPNRLRSHLTVPAGLGFWIESYSREARGTRDLPLPPFSLTQRRKGHFTSANLTNQSLVFQRFNRQLALPQACLWSMSSWVQGQTQWMTLILRSSSLSREGTLGFHLALEMSTVMLVFCFLTV